MRRSSPICAFPRRRSRATAGTRRLPSAGSASSTGSKRSTASAPSLRAEIAAAALALAYVKRTQFEARPALSAPTRRARGASLEIDPATRANLELTRTLSGARDGSLLATIDLTMTPAGARLIAERLASPLTDPETINRRLDSPGFLIEAAPMRDALRRALAHAPDFLRALSRLSLDRGGPRDLAAIRDGLAAAATLAGILERAQDLPSELLSAHARLSAECAELRHDLETTLAEDLPLLKRDGGFVRPGVIAALDEALSSARPEPARDRRIAGVLRRRGGRETAEDQA